MITIFKNWVSFCKKAESYTQSQFYKCQWQKSSNLKKSYLIYRWTIAILFLVLLIAAIVNISKTVIDCAKFFIYLTHWGFILCTIQATLAACLITSKHKEMQNTKTDAEKEKLLSKPSVLLETYWIMYSMSVVCAFGITIIFWTKVYVPSYYELDVMTFVLHGLNTVLMFLDVVIVAHPLKFMHFLWTFGFVLIYLFFSYIYYLAGGTNRQNHTFIYHSLNWDKPQHALEFCTSSLLFGFIIHICMWVFSATVRRISGVSLVTQNQNESLNYPHLHQNSVTVVSVSQQ